MKVKTIVTYLLMGLMLNSCSKNNDNNQNNNPNIPNVYVDTGNQINTNLVAQYGALELVNNPMVIPNYGINGIVVVNTGFGNYSAFELSDPNHAITNCSNLVLDGTIVTCSCNDGNSYHILSGGLPQTGTTGQYTLVRYQVEVSGSIIRIYN